MEGETASSKLVFSIPNNHPNFSLISMTTKEEEEVANPNVSPVTFLEITCTSSGKVRRFSAGAEAGFAVQLINRKLGSEAPHASYIEAIKEGEEPISFGPNSVLVDYGDGWKLQTVSDEGFEKDNLVRATCKKIPAVVVSKKIPAVVRPDGSHPIGGSANKSKPEPQPRINFQYVGRILLVFILMFSLAGLFTFALENLPRLLLFISSSM